MMRADSGGQRFKEGLFLSIVTRTQGKRNESLVEVLTCLAGQTNTNFELLVVGHNVATEKEAGLQTVIGDSPQWLREKIRYLKVDGGGRSRPLNVGFEAAQGQYIVALDDDDLVLGNYVEVFYELARANPGRAVRAGNTLQNVERVQSLGALGVRAVGPFRQQFSPEFDFAEHLGYNQTPNMSIAFPRGVFHDHQLRFDEELTTTEDWDFLVRAVCICDAASTTTITSIYRWWVSHESSRTAHDRDEWAMNEERAMANFEKSLLHVPRGTVRSIRDLVRRNKQLESMIAMRQGAHGTAYLELDTLRVEVMSILMSASWKLTAPLRLGSLLAKRRRITFEAVWNMNVAELAETLSLLKRSKSWRATSFIRKLRA